MKTPYTNYYKTPDNEQLFYQANFDPFENEYNEDILIFNYGLVCSNHHWIHQLDFFAAQGYKILTHDYRGHYQSSGIKNLSSITFENLTNDLYGLINHLNIKRPILIGHSMGVNICLEFTKCFPDIVAKQVLISGTTMPVYDIMFDSNVVDQVQPYIKKLLKAYPTAFTTFWKFGGWNPIIKKLIHAGGFNIKTVSSEFIEVYLNKLGQLGPELFFQLLDQMQFHQILGEVEIISTKSLIIGGDKDKVIPNYLQRLLADTLQDAELYIVKNGSHVPQVDFPEFVNERIIEFIKS
jgi:pimeloyl-ACP methyl ester carboxylesterase